MKYYLGIDCVDGETRHFITSTSKERTLEFLRKYDHEGSSLVMAISNGREEQLVHNADLIYKELGAVSLEK